MPGIAVRVLTGIFAAAKHARQRHTVFVRRCSVASW
jgi:hypothetical protein